MLLRNLTQWQCLALAGTREEDVDLSLLALDRLEQAVQIVQIGCVTLDSGYIPANRLTASSSCSCLRPVMKT